MPADNQVYNVENQSSTLYQPFHNGLVFDGTDLWTAIAEQTTHDIIIRSSSDGASWSTAHTYTAGANESEAIGPRVLVDEDNYVHVFSVLNDSVLGYRMKHSTNRTGSWVTTDITATIGDATTAWSNFVLNYYSDSGTAKVFITYWDSATPTIKTSLYNLEAKTLDWSEDSLGADSGGSISQYWAAGNNSPTDLGTPAIFYLNGTTAKYARRTGVATWAIGSITFGTARTRTSSPRFHDVYCPDTGSNSYVAMEFYSAPNYRVEIFTWDGTNTLTTDGYFTNQGALTSNFGTLHSNTSGDFYYTVPCRGLSGQRWIELATKPAAGSWPASATVILGSTGSSDPDYLGPRAFCMHHQKNFSSSQPINSYVFIYLKVTSPATYESRIYTGAASVISQLAGYNESFTEGGEAGDTVFGFSLSQSFSDGAEAGDSVVGISTNQAFTEGAEAGDTINIDVTQTLSEGADAGDTVAGTKQAGSEGSGTYPYYSAAGLGQQFPAGASGPRNEYPEYTATGIGINPDIGTVDIVYPEYTATGVGLADNGGVTDQYTTEYPIYTATGVGATGYTGTATITYGVYGTTSGLTSYYGKPYFTVSALTPDTGVGSMSYDEYTVSGAGPGASTTTDFSATASATYRAYTVSVTTKAEYSSTGSATYPLYAAAGVGLHDGEATAESTYPPYEAYAEGINGNIGTASMEYPEVAFAYDSNNIQIASYTIVATGYQDNITGTASMSYPRMVVDSHGTPDNLEVYTGRLVTGDGEAILDGQDNFILVFDPKPAEYEVVFSAMNLQKKAVTEYANFDFNSISRDGETIYGASSDGIYILGDSSDDDGTSIVANVEKLEVDYETGMRKRATDAYVYLQSNGSYEFSSVADGTRSDQTISDTDTVMHTRKIDLAKGLIGRGLGWAMKSDGTDFEVEEVELVVDIGSRRSKRYSSG